MPLLRDFPYFQNKRQTIFIHFRDCIFVKIAIIYDVLHVYRMKSFLIIVQTVYSRYISCITKKKRKTYFC